MVIGIDFDNTIINYDQLFHGLAQERGWLHGQVVVRKQGVRDHLRGQPAGEQRWQELQALAYGEEIMAARLEQGVVEFLAWCEAKAIPYAVVSHKSPFAAARPGGVNLQEQARAWLQRFVFSPANGLQGGLDQVFFEPDRQQKIERIKTLACSHFIDDLVELFDEPAFPAQVQAILFTAQPPSCFKGPSFASWPVLHGYFKDLLP